MIYSAYGLLLSVYQIQRFMQWAVDVHSLGSDEAPSADGYKMGRRFDIRV
jgi:hypothetical protein